MNDGKNDEETAKYYQEFADSQQFNEPSKDAAEALLYLVNYNMGRNNIEQAETLATRLLSWPFPVSGTA